MKPIKLRPHHVSVVAEHIENTRANTPEWKKAAADYRARQAKVYGEKAVRGFEEIAMGLIKTPNRTVNLVSDCDALCKVCDFEKGCKVGDYSLARAAYEAVGIKLAGGTPESEDEAAAKSLGLDLEKPYTVSELFRDALGVVG